MFKRTPAGDPKYRVYNVLDTPKIATSDRYVEMETVLFSLPAIVTLPAILAFEIENFLSLRLQRSLRQREAD